MSSDLTTRLNDEIDEVTRVIDLLNELQATGDSPFPPYSVGYRDGLAMARSAMRRVRDGYSIDECQS